MLASSSFTWCYLIEKSKLAVGKILTFGCVSYHNSFKGTSKFDIRSNKTIKKIESAIIKILHEILVYDTVKLLFFYDRKSYIVADL